MADTSRVSTDDIAGLNLLLRNYVFLYLANVFYYFVYRINVIRRNLPPVRYYSPPGLPFPRIRTSNYTTKIRAYYVDENSFHLMGKRIRKPIEMKNCNKKNKAGKKTRNCDVSLQDVFTHPTTHPLLFELNVYLCSTFFFGLYVDVYFLALPFYQIIVSFLKANLDTRLL